MTFKRGLGGIQKYSHLPRVRSQTHLLRHSFEEEVQQLQALGNFLSVSLQDTLANHFQTLQIKWGDEACITGAGGVPKNHSSQEKAENE